MSQSGAVPGLFAELLGKTDGKRKHSPGDPNPRDGEFQPAPYQQFQHAAYWASGVIFSDRHFACSPLWPSR